MNVYEDGALVVSLPEKPAVPGHVVVTPVQEASHLRDLPPEVVEHLFTVASLTATALFEGLGAQGTNILCVEGDGQVHIDVLARSQDDGLDLFWEPKRADPADLDAVASQVKEQLWYVGKEERTEDKEAVAEEVQKTKEEVDASPEDNYKVRQLFRTP